MRAIGLLVLVAMLVALGVAGPPPVAAAETAPTIGPSGITQAATLDTDFVQAAQTPCSPCPDIGMDDAVVSHRSNFDKMKTLVKATSDTATRAAPAIAADARHYMVGEDAYATGAMIYMRTTAQETFPASVPYAGAG